MVSHDLNVSSRNADGSFKDMHSLKVLIFRGGLTPSLRKEAWKYLLGIYDCNKSAADNIAVCFFFICILCCFQFCHIIIFHLRNARKKSFHVNIGSCEKSKRCDA